MAKIFRASYRESGTPLAFWVVSILFILVGLLFGVAVPRLILSAERPVSQEALATQNEMVAVFSILGLIFLALGAVILILMVISLHVRARHPEKLALWYWWVNFIGGVLGALVFALPSSLVLPFLCMMHHHRPNMFFEAQEPFGSKHLLLGIVFSVLGILVLIGTFFVARAQYRGRPVNRD